MSLRSAVREHLADNCPSFSGGFFEPQIATKKTEKPFGVIRIAGDEGHSKQGITKRVQVMVHCAREGYDDLDSLVYEVVDALDDTEIEDEDKKFIPSHTGTTGDYNDDDRETITRTAEFEVVIAR